VTIENYWIESLPATYKSILAQPRFDGICVHRSLSSTAILLSSSLQFSLLNNRAVYKVGLPAFCTSRHTIRTLKTTLKASLYSRSLSFLTLEILSYTIVQRSKRINYFEGLTLVRKPEAR